MSFEFPGLQAAAVYQSDKKGQLSGGVYDVEITNIISKETRNNGDALIVEFKLLASSNPADVVGTERSWYRSVGLTKVQQEMAAKEVKKFLYAALGYDIKTQFKEAEANLAPHLNVVLTEARLNGKLNGTKVHVETFENKGFQNYVWSPYKG